MAIISIIASACLLVIILLDGFETMVLPRRVTRRYRLTRFFYRATWLPWQALALRMRPGKRRESFLSIFGPMSILLLFGCWMSALMFAFGWLHWSLESALDPPGTAKAFSTYLYMSGTTIFTLGLGDVVPTDGIGRFLTVLEAGTGFGFMAVVIGYLPVLYQAFSRRETIISMLDARAGSPPSGGEFLLRVARARDIETIPGFLQEFEHWAAELLESHLSFPVLSFYRSQHDNQSWLGALTALLDACALLIAMVKDVSRHQAELTFAMGRHALVDLALVFHTPPQSAPIDRMPHAAVDRLRDELRSAGIALNEETAAYEKLAELRAMYEPFLVALSHHFVYTVPPLCRGAEAIDNWQTSAWMRRTVGIGKLGSLSPTDDHFA